MVQIRIDYEDGLRTRCVHGPSGSVLVTDAPLDNQGQGESFSPTDLVATALGACILTTMGVVAQKQGWRFHGGSATVEKHMVADPARRVGKLVVRLRLPGAYDAKARATLEEIARTCPVARSLDPRIELPVTIEWDPQPAAR